MIFIFQVEEFLVEAVNKDVQLDAGDYFKVTFFNKNYRKLICLDGGRINQLLNADYIIYFDLDPLIRIRMEGTKIIDAISFAQMFD